MDQNMQNKEVGIVAYMPDFIITGAGIGAVEAARMLEAKGINNVIIVNHEDMIKHIDIDGVKYVEREQPQRKSVMSSRMGIMAHALMIGMAGHIGTSSYTREKPRVDILDEYRLIMQKKSNLSKRDRDWVVNQFHKYYKKVEDGI